MNFGQRKVKFDELGDVFPSEMPMLFELQAAGVMVNEPVSILFNWVNDSLVTQICNSFSPIYYRRTNHGWDQISNPDDPDFVILYNEGPTGVSTFRDVMNVVCEDLEEEQHAERLFPTETPIVFVTRLVGVPRTRFDFVYQPPSDQNNSINADPTVSVSYPNTSINCTVTGEFSENDFDEFRVAAGREYHSTFNIDLHRYVRVLAGLYGIEEIDDEFINHAPAYTLER